VAALDDDVEVVIGHHTWKALRDAVQLDRRHGACGPGRGGLVCSSDGTRSW